MEKQADDKVTIPVTSAMVGRGLSDLCPNSKKLRSFDEEEERNEDEEQIPNSSDLNVEEKSVTAELVHSNKCLKRLYTDLQKSLEISEDSNTFLRAENDDLKNQIKSIKQSIQDGESLINELEDLRAEKAKKEQICSEVEAGFKELEKENKKLKDQIEAFASEVSSTRFERERHERDNAELSYLLRALQEQVEEYQLCLDQKDELIHEKDFVIEQLKDSVSEYITINQDMKEKLKDLEGQLALALVTNEGSFMNVDYMQPLAPQHSVSIGEELGILPQSQMEFSIEEEKGEDSDDVNLTEQIMENEESEEVKISEVKDIKAAEPLKEEHAPKRWLTNCNDGRTCAAGLLCVGVLVYLGLLRVMMPAFYDNAGLSCADVIWYTARRLIEPYCSIHYVGLPPV
ncbi:girdin-like isoform X2 [Trichomycterus rosablanca]|uniref:girdin-like isoform X2 n=1 Tax=Trichomycterus rosablanca TaxID=2290929 RepID=UPI002F3550D0